MRQDNPIALNRNFPIREIHDSTLAPGHIFRILCYAVVALPQLFTSFSLVNCDSVCLSAKIMSASNDRQTSIGYSLYLLLIRI